MAYAGYFIAIDGDQLPFSYMKHDSYKVSPNQRQDLDSYTDQLGYLHRNALDHVPTKAEWQSPIMEYAQFKVMMNFFVSKYTIYKERKVPATYYDFETDTYKSGQFYMPDYSVEVYHANSTNFIVNPITFKIIEY